MIIGTVQTGGDEMYVSGVQGNSGAGFFTQDFCLAQRHRRAERVAHLRDTTVRAIAYADSDTTNNAYAYSYCDGYTNAYGYTYA